MLALTAGGLGALAFVALAFGRNVGQALDNDSLSSVWSVVRWPLALALLVAMVALLFRWSRAGANRRGRGWPSAPRCRSVCCSSSRSAWRLMFRVSTSFGDTYGPLAGIVALLLWALLAAIGLFLGAAVAAQLEAVRAGARAPQDDREGRAQRCGPGARARAHPVMMEVVDTPSPRGHNGHRPAVGPQTSPPLTTQTPQIRRMLEGVIGVPATEGNRIEVLRNGDEIFPAMLEAIDGAEHTIDFLTFVYWQGEIGDDLRREAHGQGGAGRAGARPARRPGAPARSIATLIADDGAARCPASTGSGRSAACAPGR